ncbi:NAD(P)/FAD-dependent oxidoreductase [Desulfuromonas sp. TF]|uniref:NAD(P)/FAD-dependent oxidoreductase n=1 Tax=Desulfuromonas sp. TF TaxID=1232410 RepID=UPI0004016E00|nr:NAD(P)/FAD-dependent oxidoreductase [Desulfuromonas sp. TF]
MQLYDVVVAGSGPAGSCCAKALKDEGFSVLVLEKEFLPRHKTCSGVLFGQTQELVRTYLGGDAPPEVYCSNKYVQADDICEWDDERGYIPYTWEIDKDGKKFSRTYQNIWRNKFDKWLLDQSGAGYRDGTRVKAFDSSGSFVKVHVQTARSNESSVFTCKYLVGADGNDSTVRRLLRAQTPESAQRQRLASFQSYYKVGSLGSLKKDGWTVFLRPDIGDYILCVHQKDEYLVMHVGGVDGRNLRDSMEKFKELLSSRFGVTFGEHWRDEGCMCELLPIFMGKENVLLTGEAAGFIYLNCEGISAAMDSGYRCGKAIARSLRSGGKSAKDLYTEDCQDILRHVEKCLTQMHFLA